MLDNKDLINASETGSIIHASIDWSCNLDQEECKPTHLFKRVDNEGNATSIGYNFRSAVYVGQNRLLTKYYGVLERWLSLIFS